MLFSSIQVLTLVVQIFQANTLEADPNLIKEQETVKNYFVTQKTVILKIFVYDSTTNENF